MLCGNDKQPRFDSSHSPRSFRSCQSDKELKWSEEGNKLCGVHNRISETVTKMLSKLPRFTPPEQRRVFNIVRESDSTVLILISLSKREDSQKRGSLLDCLAYFICGA